MEGGAGSAGVYHQNNPPAWEGPDAFYRNDYRAPPAPHESETWNSIYVWASNANMNDLMHFSVQADTLFAPPSNRQYVLELITVPGGISGAPLPGTTWAVPSKGTLTVEMPTFRTSNGLEGYEFAFTIGAVPEPTTLSICAIAVAIGLARKRRHTHR